MTMNARKTILATLLAAMAVTPLAVAPLQVQAQAQATHVYTQAELDQMLAPIALYPDALLSQVLMAATYPIEVVEAARWSRANPGLQGDDAVRAVQDEDWDPSVKSLVAFPQILQRMDEKLEWTRSLGDAFLAQEPQMMDQVQQLRRRAQATGSLRSDEQIRVEQQGPTIVVRPASPEYVYVPYYDPQVVYGSWWWPAYQPVVWSPWPGYARHYRPGVSVGFWWGRPVGLSLGFFFGDFDWQRRHVRVVHANNFYYRQPAFVNRAFVADRGRWQHDPQHRRGVDYRQAEVRQRFAGAQVERREALREERRDERRLERRADRQPAQVQAQPAARVQAQPQAPSVAERRADRREERQAARQSPPAAAVQTQPQTVTPQRAERREERREERRAERQAAPAAAPVQAQPQPVAQPRVEARQERREERQAARVQVQPQAQPAAQPRIERREERQAARVQAQPQAQPQPQVRAQPQAQPQPQARPQPEARPQQQARPQPEARPSMPAAQAPQTPRAERQEQRQERREQREERREERRNERGQKAG
jgi:hypothetical protein